MAKMNINKSIDSKVQVAFNYASWFYSCNNRGVDNQRLCINHMVKLTGFDFGTCVKIQSPILSMLMANDTINLGNNMIHQHLAVVASQISSSLLNVNKKNIEECKSNSDAPEPAPKKVAKVSKTPLIYSSNHDWLARAHES